MSSGRAKPKYAWDEMEIHGRCYIDEAGLPEKQARMREVIKNYCETTGVATPSDSALTRFVSRTFYTNDQAG